MTSTRRSAISTANWPPSPAATATSDCYAPRRVSARSWATRSPANSATSNASPHRGSCAATPACAPGSTNPDRPNAAARSPRTAPATCAGRTSKPPPTPPHHRSTASTTSAPGLGSAGSAAPRSPVLRSPANLLRRPGTCSPRENPSLRQAPRTHWPPEGPLLIAPPDEFAHRT